MPKLRGRSGNWIAIGALIVSILSLGYTAMNSYIQSRKMRTQLFISQGLQNRPILSISEKPEVTKVEFRIEVANEVFTVGIDLTNVHPFTSDIDVALFTNFLANKHFIDLLKKGEEISISMVGPPQIVEAFDLPNELFKLNGFSANHLKAVEACKDPTVLNIPPRTR